MQISDSDPNVPSWNKHSKHVISTFWCLLLYSSVVDYYTAAEQRLPNENSDLPSCSVHEPERTAL